MGDGKFRDLQLGNMLSVIAESVSEWMFLWPHLENLYYIITCNQSDPDDPSLSYELLNTLCVSLISRGVEKPVEQSGYMGMYLWGAWGEMLDFVNLNSV